jgi:DNA-binding MarR family transcriptional regulator
MSNIKGSKLFRETIRILERKLEMMEDGELAGRGITPAQCHALIEIGRMNTKTLNELSHIMSLDASTLSRTVNNLVTSGLVLREADPEDRRCVSITLTERGAELYADMENTMDVHFDMIFARVPEQKRGQILEYLILIIEAMDKSGCCPS